MGCQLGAERRKPTENIRSAAASGGVIYGKISGMSRLAAPAAAPVSAPFLPAGSGAPLILNVS